nr:DUF5716 family protein [uncultured Oribacterium sp.]
MKVIGIALSDEYTDISLYKEEYTYRFPTLLSREKKEDLFYIGEDAYKKNLDGNVFLVDKLLSLFKKKGSATFSERRYEAGELLGIFLESLLLEGERRVAGRDIPEEEGKDVLVLSIRDVDVELLHRLHALLKEKFSLRYEITLISHAESFLHYILRQDKKFYNRQVGMLEFSSQILYYYEAQVSKGAKKYAVSVSEAQPDALSFGILEDPRGRKMTDQVLSGMIDRIVKGKVYSAFFLAGKGFENTELFPEFMKKLLHGRRVLVESFLFSIGALYYGQLLGKGEEEEYLLLCDTRVNSDIVIRVSEKEREFPLYLAHAGDSFLKEGEDIHLLLDKQDYIDFQVQDVRTQGKGKQYRMNLTTFPKRERRCTKVAVRTVFSGKDSLLVEVTDMGLGELWEGSFQSIKETIPLGGKE